MNLKLLSSFPESIRGDVLHVLSALPPSFLPPAGDFCVIAGGEFVAIPYRVYYDDALIDGQHLSPIQQAILSCLLTRHHNGFVREVHLSNIVACRHNWVAPFVIQLVGEYVQEILRVIYANRTELDKAVYREFLKANPAFWAATRCRVASYWDCYYRWIRREDYVGFHLLEHLDSLLDEEER